MRISRAGGEGSLFDDHSQLMCRLVVQHGSRFTVSQRGKWDERHGLLTASVTGIGVGTGGATAHGGHGPLTFQPKFFLKSFLSFLNTVYIRKTIHRDEESTNLRRNAS